MSGGAQPSGSTTTTSTPPSYMYPYLGTALGQANALLANGGPQYYPGPQLAAFNPTQQGAMKGIVGLGMNGTPALSAAQGLDRSLLSGGGSNPWLDQAFQQAAGATQNQLASEFAGSGRNVAASEPLRAEQLNNLATSIYGGNYQNTLADALQAGNQAQSLYDTRLQGLGAAAGVGQQVQNQSQALIDASKNAFNYNQMLPYQNLQQYEGFLSGVQPGQQQTNPYFTNPMANALGMGLGAEQLYKGMGGSKGGSSAGTGGGPNAVDSNPFEDPWSSWQP